MLAPPITATLTFLEDTAAGVAKRPAALRIQPAAAADDDVRTPVHFIALIDISQSMDDSDKLTHVKHCLSLLLQFLTPADELSLITFGETASVLLKRAPGDSANRTTIEATIRTLHTDGCTNLSAGLAEVSKVLDQDSPHKPMLLVLTDGHANRGVTSPAQLQEMTATLQARTPALTFSFVAYGTDHNATLLQEMAAQHMTSYSIVRDLESAALTMGESLGAATACCAQTVRVQCPPGTVAHGAYKAGEDGAIYVGDLYAGSDIFILLDIPTVEAAAPATCTVQGVSIPSLIPFTVEAVVCTNTSPGPEIVLARLQVRCSELFRAARTVGNPSSNEGLCSELAALKAALQDTSLDGHPIADMLRQEIPSLEEVFRADRTWAGAALSAQLAAHEQYVRLGRGTSQPIHLVEPAIRQAHLGGPRVWSIHRSISPVWGGIQSEAEEENPEAPPPQALRAAASYLSPTTSTRTRRMAEAMQSASQNPGAGEPPATD
jgi:Mg-chelatase subunit ChlD